MLDYKVGVRIGCVLMGVDGVECVVHDTRTPIDAKDFESSEILTNCRKCKKLMWVPLRQAECKAPTCRACIVAKQKESSQYRWDKAKAEAESRIGTTIQPSDGGKPTTITYVKMKRHGYVYGATCVDCGKEVEKSSFAIVKKKETICISCSLRRNGAKRRAEKGDELKPEPKKQVKRPPTRFNTGPLHPASVEQFQTSIEDSLRGTWKRYDDDEYQQKLEELNKQFGT